MFTGVYKLQAVFTMCRKCLPVFISCRQCLPLCTSCRQCVYKLQAVFTSIPMTCRWRCSDRRLVAFHKKTTDTDVRSLCSYNAFASTFTAHGTLKKKKELGKKKKKKNLDNKLHTETVIGSGLVQPGGAGGGGGVLRVCNKD